MYSDPSSYGVFCAEFFERSSLNCMTPSKGVSSNWQILLTI